MLRTITGKVSLSLLLFLALLVGVALLSVRESLRITATTQHLGTATLAEAELNAEFMYHIGRTITELVSAAALHSTEELDEATEMLAEAQAVQGQFLALGADEHAHDHDDFNARRAQLLVALEEAAVGVGASLSAPTADGLILLLEELEELEEEVEHLRADQRSSEQALAAADVADVVASTRMALITAPLQFLVIGLLSGLAVWLLHRFVVRPVRELAQVTGAIGAGQLDQPVPDGGIDEVGVLQGAIRQMVANLRRRDQQVAERTQEAQDALSALELRAAEQARLLTELSEQRDLVRGLSVPVLPVGRQLVAIPLVGALDAERLEQVREQALSAIERTGARTVLLDVTGVAVVDDAVAAALLTVIRAARLLGATIELAGISPEVAQTLVGVGVTLEGIRCHGSLEQGLDLAFRRSAAGDRSWAALSM
jgi:anti-anti-sigma regulatory factor/HAMP domain-containing protein